MGIIGPCKNCADRSVGCHGICKTYNDYVVKNEKAKKWLKEQNDRSFSADHFSDAPPKKGWRSNRGSHSRRT